MANMVKKAQWVLVLEDIVLKKNKMTWQAFLKAASKRNTKNLKGMILRDIQNKGTWKVLR